MHNLISKMKEMEKKIKGGTIIRFVGLHNNVFNSLPIILARASAIFETMEPVPVTHNNFPVNNCRDQFESGMTVFTNTEILHYPNHHPRGRVYQSKTEC